MIITLTKLEDLLKEITTSVFHNEAFKASAPYIVYSEYRKRNKFADNRPLVGAWRVQVDYYTKLHIDINSCRIEELLYENEIPFKHNKVFDAELKLNRHIFDLDGVHDG